MDQMMGKQTVVSADHHVPQQWVVDVSGEERDWLDELRILSDLIIALAHARGQLTEEDLDRALGLEPPREEALTAG